MRKAAFCLLSSLLLTTQIVAQPAANLEGRPSVGYAYEVTTVSNDDRKSSILLQVTVDTANNRALSTSSNLHGSNTILLRNDLNKLCLLTPQTTTTLPSTGAATPPSTNTHTHTPDPASFGMKCVCYSFKGQVLPLPDPVTNVSFAGFEVVEGGGKGEEEMYGGKEVQRLRLSVVTVKNMNKKIAASPSSSLRGSSQGMGKLTDQFDVSALLDVETGLPLVVSFANATDFVGGKAARVEYYKNVMRGGPVDEALFEVPGMCVDADEERGDEALAVVLNRFRYKPFAATTATVNVMEDDENENEEGQADAAAALTSLKNSTTTNNILPPNSGNPDTTPTTTTTTTPSSSSSSTTTTSTDKNTHTPTHNTETNPVKANLAMIKAHNTNKLTSTSSSSLTYTLTPNRFLHVRPQEFFSRYALRATNTEEEEAEIKRYTVYTSPAVTVAAAGVAVAPVGGNVGLGVNENESTTSTSTTTGSTTPASATAIPSLPSSLDWRSEGKVTPVRDQGVCMCAYAQAAAAALETAIAVAGGALTPLSVQSLVDCVGGEDDDDENTPPHTHTHIIASKGCNGGWPLTALTHIETQGEGKLLSEEEYPFFEVEGVCPSLSSMQGVVDPPPPDTAEQPLEEEEEEENNVTATTTTTGTTSTTSTTSTTTGPLTTTASTTTTKKATPTQTHTPLPPPPSAAAEYLLTDVALVPRGDETLLAAAVAEHGAVVVTIEMREDFLFYGGGIYDNPSCTGKSLDHHLVIVGFTPEAWLAKNSFGPSWGEEGGYIRIARGKNMCGLANWAVVPIVG